MHSPLHHSARIHRRRAVVLLSLLVVVSSLSSDAVLAQEETICDPENPACKPAKPAPKPAKPDTVDTAPARTTGGEETICDPENPACKRQETRDTPPAKRAGEEEAICDPENPACKPAKPAKTTAGEGGEEAICDPENPACKPAKKAGPALAGPTLTGPTLTSPITQSGTFSNASFRGAWGTTLAVDTSFDGAGEDIVEWMNSMDLTLSYDVSARMKVHLEGQFRHWAAGRENPDAPDFLFNATEPRGELFARLGEAYVLWRPGRWSLRLGNLLTPWGSTDIMRPGDVVNPADMQNLGAVGPGAASRRIPQLTAALTYTGEGWALSGLLVPFFTPDRITIYGKDTGFAQHPQSPIARQLPVTDLFNTLLDPSVNEEVQPLLTSSTYPDELPKNISLGARLTGTVWNTDLGLGYFFGWDRTLWTEVDEDVQTFLAVAAQDERFAEDGNLIGLIIRNPRLLPVVQSITRKQQQGDRLVSVEPLRKHSIVLDAARYIGPIGVRLDVAFSPQQTFITESLRSMRRPTTFSALGLSYERVDNDRPFALTVEGFVQHVAGHNNALTRAFVSEDRQGDPADTPLLLGDLWYGLAGGVNWRMPLLDLDLQTGALYGISNSDVIWNTRLSRSWERGYTVSLAYTLNHGPSLDERLTLGGLLDRNDQLILGVSGVF